MDALHEEPEATQVWRFEGSLTPGQFDALVHGTSPDLTAATRAVLDLSDVIYVDAPCLLQTVALFKWAANSGVNLRLALPRNQRVRDFFRAWNLQPALRAATGVPMHRLVNDARDLSYFGEDQKYYLGRLQRGSAKASEAYQRLLSNKFFALLPYHRDAAVPPDRIVRDEWNRWRNPYIMAVLAHHLSGEVHEIPRVVIYELILNAVQHPNAALMLPTSRALGLDADSPKIKQLTICVWDDGDTIASTLRKQLAKGLSVKEPRSTDESIDQFRITAHGWHAQSRTRISDEEPALGDPDEILLLSSLFDGVSERANRSTDGRPVGTGLFGLYRTVIKTLGGSVSIRSGDDFMHVKAALNAEHVYQAKLQRFSGLPFLGNLITVRIPLQ